MTNPYQPPQDPTVQPKTSAPFLSRRRVFWFGVGAIVIAIALIEVSHSLFIQSRSMNGVSNTGMSDTVVFMLQGMALLAFVSGVISLITYHWFPDPRRKYLWRRRQRKETTMEPGPPAEQANVLPSDF